MKRIIIQSTFMKSDMLAGYDLQDYTILQLSAVEVELFSFSLYDILIIDYASFNTPIAQFNCVVLDYEKLNTEEQSVLTNRIRKGEIDGIIDLSRSLLTKFTIENLVMKSSFNYLDRNLDKVVASSRYHLAKIEKLHKKTSLFRSEDIGGATLVGKFVAGNKTGGDFFDIAHGPGQVFFLLSSTSSHILSGAVMSNFESFRNNRNFDINQIEYFLQKLNKYRQDIGLSEERLDILAFTINLNNLSCTGINVGNNQIVDSKNVLLPKNKDFSNLKNAYFNFYLERGDKLLILSRGFFLNTTKQYISKFQEGLDKVEDPKDYLGDIYIDLKSRFSGSFLDYDASFIYLGVKENVFIEISND